MLLPEMSVPKTLVGERVRVLFVVDSRGRVERISFPVFNDRDYTRAFMEAMRSAKFRPAVTADGMPVRGYYTYDVELGGKPLP